MKKIVLAGLSTGLLLAQAQMALSQTPQVEPIIIPPVEGAPIVDPRIDRTGTEPIIIPPVGGAPIVDPTSGPINTAPPEPFRDSRTSRQKDDDWGCTIFLCVAAVVDPFSIADCAEALLKIRPWRLPTCSAGEDFATEAVDLSCPSGFQFIPARIENISVADPEFPPEVRDLIEEREGRGSRQIRRVPARCVDPTNQRTAPVGDYGEGFEISFRDEDGLLRRYSFRSDY